VAYSIISGIAGRERAADKTTQCTRLACDHVTAEDEKIDILEKQVDQRRMVRSTAALLKIDAMLDKLS
jgi:hypothetical protein